MPISYRLAHDLDTAWSNFEPDVPLQPNERGENHAFYVNRPDEVMSRLKRKLLRSSLNPPKYFLSGHRGCGKSTEMYRLAADAEIQGKYYPVHFSVRHHADVNDMDFKDVLFLIGGQLYTQYTTRTGRLTPQLQNELEAWRGRLEEEIVTLRGGRITGELGAELSNPFAKLSSKFKVEPHTRHAIRQVLERDVTGLIDIINKITAEILAKTKKLPLVLIDDLDKITDWERARQIFIHQQDIMCQPNCAIIYTVSSALFYDEKFPTARMEPIFLPNIALHERGHRERRRDYYTLKTFIVRRMHEDLLTEEGLEEICRMSGGVFRELARLVRNSIEFVPPNQTQLSQAEVEQAATEWRNTYWRILKPAQKEILRAIRDGDYQHDPAQVGPLLQNLAVLEYNGEGAWFDVHPVLLALL